MSFLGKHHSKQARGKISKAKKGNKCHFGHKHSEETKRKMSEAMKGENNPNYGRKGKKNPNWKGGQIIHEGYVFILKPDHPKANSYGYVKRARLVAEKTLGRYLKSNEIPHHKNERRDDDRPENIDVMTGGEHTSLHHKQRRINKAKSL